MHRHFFRLCSKNPVIKSLNSFSEKNKKELKQESAHVKKIIDIALDVLR